jgi:hypothetical protein
LFPVVEVVDESGKFFGRGTDDEGALDAKGVRLIRGRDENRDDGDKDEKADDSKHGGG